ncbi:class I SAM-dependent methyltransferase [Methylobacterium isbiliense]|uniref:class I SAM-dependent methyltransferase n=1 Tax=Methylobacterium isbiliense TaxID=315478 RepID=UPI001EDE0302|nr:class I SAM-dependent methyltransferase [Methylobacterium isbiliense]MDN3625496.1 class I SAM-dependent methyltransferase [Methylobacterium isbiliense]
MAGIPMKDRRAMDHRNEIIAKLSPGKSFAEVGGLWGLANEKVSVAHAAGATDLCMIDIWKPHDNWWVSFRNHCKERNIPYIREIIGSIDNVDIVRQVGVYDVVHCSGVLYHCPNPILTISHLAAITRDILLLGTAVMPASVVNEAGSVQLDKDHAIFVPSITEEKRKVYEKYISEAYGGGAWGINNPVDDWYFSSGAPNYGPWWWLWTHDYVRGLIEASGLKVIEEFDQFNGTGRLFACAKQYIGTENFGQY